MRNLRSHPTQRRDHYQELTDRIVAALEAGVAPWRRPWDPNACGGSNMPVNVATGHRYRGVNLFALAMSPLAFRRRSALVQLQAGGGARMAGAQRRKGDARLLLQEARNRGQNDGRRPRDTAIPLLRAFSVFHASQLDGIPELGAPEAPKPVPERINDVELIIEASGVPVRIGGERAFYSPAPDHIQMPPDEAFHGPEQRAVAVLHELAHASGHPPVEPRSEWPLWISSLRERRASSRLTSFPSEPCSGCPATFPITRATSSPGSRC